MASDEVAHEDMRIRFINDTTKEEEGDIRGQKRIRLAIGPTLSCVY